MDRDLDLVSCCVGISTGQNASVAGFDFFHLITSNLWIIVRTLCTPEPVGQIGEKIRRGNVAVAIKMAGVIIAIAMIIQSGVIGITASLG